MRNDRFLDGETTAALVQGRHGDPFALLGPHITASGAVIRALLPGADAVSLIGPEGETVAELRCVHPDGLFEAALSELIPYRFRINWHGVTQETEDPYAFPPLLGELDIYLLAEGRHRQIGTCLGAQPMEVAGVAGVRFAVWAPNARRVSVIGNFNGWDGRRNPMRLRIECGVWEIFIPRLFQGELYKYEIFGADGTLTAHADPVARAAEAPPATASIVASAAPFAWSDRDWQAQRVLRKDAAPLAIYEVHVSSWRRHADGRSLSWEVLAEQLIPYVRDLGFTHLELMPVMLHPFGGSWGYQPLGQFVPMPEFGPPEAFAAFVDRCHRAGLGVILDWVPAHFPADAHGLARFDGTALYEHLDPREGMHRDWNTFIYNLGRNEVRGFLIGSALYWLEHFHADGLRVDAVASMLYRDYSRTEGEWIPNRYGGRENLEAIAFLQELSRAIGETSPGAMLIAEESTAWPGVTRPASEDGLGFTHKWNMGWMHDTLRYISRDPVHRSHHHDDMTFGLLYAFFEHFILPISHDEVVYGKGSLLGRMPGDHWQKFANLRAYLAFMWTHPGKKLLFMGGEFGQSEEWNHDTQLSWHLLNDPMHAGLLYLLRDLNAIYRRESALFARDFTPDGFRWVIVDDRMQSVFAWLRFGIEDSAPLMVLCNFTPVPLHDYRVGVPEAGRWAEVLNTDASVYGGSGMGNLGGVNATACGSHGFPAALTLTLPPLAVIALKRVG
ncbi:MAG TPA: 1,4-alpha-glucan branching protein GlgB [Acetobacteraceae bacterium]|nr:1,4-alpha-glucan branching protein GlgB [Acetobacteraceae bacterium]